MAHDGCNCYLHFVLSGIFRSIFLQRVKDRKNSILNWVIKLNFIKLPLEFFNSKKNCCCCRQTMCRLCLCSQRELWKPIFQQYGDLKLKKYHFGAHLGSTSWRQSFEETVKKLNLWRRTTVDKSAYIKAWIYFSVFRFKTPEDIINLHKCTQNHDNVLHCSCDMVCDRCHYFSFLAIFCPFTPRAA